MSRNTAETNKITVIEEWRRYGREYLAKHRPSISFEQFRANAIAILRSAVTSCYLERLELSRLDESPSELGKKYLVSPATILKWSGKHDSERLQDMTFSRACVIAAAGDVMFPRGLQAAVTGTRKTFEYVARELGFNDAAKVDDETVLWLYFIVRSEEWQRVQSKQTASRERGELKRAVSGIMMNVSEWHPLSKAKESGEVEEISKHGRIQTQAVLEAVIDHDWFG